MSNIKVDSAARDGERHGNEYDTRFPLSGRSGESVEASSGNNGQTASRNTANAGEAFASLNSGMCVRGRAQERAVRVDQVNVADGERHLPADRLGDIARKAVDKAADNGGPRRPVGQAPLSGKQSPGGFQSYPGNRDDSDD